MPPKKVKKYKAKGDHGAQMLEAAQQAAKKKPKEEKNKFVPQNKYMAFSQTSTGFQSHHLHGP